MVLTRTLTSFGVSIPVLARKLLLLSKRELGALALLLKFSPSPKLLPDEFKEARVSGSEANVRVACRIPLVLRVPVPFSSSLSGRAKSRAWDSRMPEVSRDRGSPAWLIIECGSAPSAISEDSDAVAMTKSPYPVDQPHIVFTIVAVHHDALQILATV